jgi:hypothetical protein
MKEPGPPLYRTLPAKAQTAYAELAEEAGVQSLLPLAAISGSFARRSIRGRGEYVYFQFRDAEGVARMAYVGPASERIDRLIRQFNEAKAARTGPAALAPAVRSAIALGCASLPDKHFRIVQKLAASGFFRAGGVLIGTHAFAAMGNMLGVRWGAATQTMDIDFAHAGRNVSVALPANVSLSVHDVLDSLEMGLLPIAEFSGRTGGQYRNPSDPESRIDFLTPHTGSDDPVEVPALGVALTPLRFIELSLLEPAQVTVLGRSDAVTVSIPAPAAFAVHKLIVQGLRPIAEQTKAQKDLDQAAALIDWHQREGHAGDVARVWRDVIGRGPGWRSRAEGGRAALARKYPSLDLSFLAPARAAVAKKKTRSDGERRR